MRITILTILLAAACAFAAVPKGVDLARLNGWDIVVAEDAIPSEVYAAKEFQSHFELASGIKLPIVKTISRPDSHIFIGPGRAMRCCPLGFDTIEFGDEDLRIVARDNNIVIAGGRPRGTLYGVYTFLEDYLGVRFLTAEHTYVPAVGKYRCVGPVDRFYHPPFNFRHIWYEELSRNPKFAARVRINAIPRDPNLGGSTKLKVVGHTFLTQVPVDKYGKEHPEYYSLVDGERRIDYKKNGVFNQLCLTNPDVLRIVTEAVLAELKANPDVANVAVSQNDGSNYCQCPNCAAIDEQEDSHSGSLITFINKVADEVAKQYPDVLVGTLAYGWSVKPPKTLKCRPNVQIQLCYRSCLNHPIDDPNCPDNAEFCKELNGWGKICNNICMWTYHSNSFDFLLPYPDLRILEPDIRYFVANNVKGVFMSVANVPSTEFSELRTYIMVNLLWNPNRSGQQLMNEFLNLHYGRAAEPIRRFIDLIHDNTAATIPHVHGSNKFAKAYGIDESVAEAGLKAFDEALGLAEDETIKTRVEKASICAYRIAVEPVWRMKDKSELDPALAEKMRPLAKRLFELCDKYGVNRPNWYEDISSYRDRIKKLLDF
jgi:hypothetical protein